MATLHLSKELVQLYKKVHIDVSYALSELLGYISTKNCSEVKILPELQSEKVEVDVDLSVLEEMQNQFDKVDSVDAAAELLLWSNFFMGGKL